MRETELVAALSAAASGEDRRNGRAARAAAAIRRFGGYRWVGLYDVAEDQIAIIGWDGPGAPAHPRFPRSEGLSGAAVSTGEVVIVGDVATDPRYLTTHATTRSEIVVPVLGRETVVGLIDVESEVLDAFDDGDGAFLRRCAAWLAPLWGLASPRAQEGDRI
jgi:GAF domain-containing protein